MITWNPVPLLAGRQLALWTSLTSPLVGMTTCCQLIDTLGFQSTYLLITHYSPLTQLTSLWRGDTRKGDLVRGVWYKPPQQGKKEDEVFSKQLQKVFVSQILVLREDFILLDLSWKGQKQSRRFLEGEVTSWQRYRMAKPGVTHSWIFYSQTMKWQPWL